MSNKSFVAGLLAGVLLLPFGAGMARAETPTRILVGFPPGGTTDGVARLYSEGLSRALGRTVLVENKPGAGGAIAATALKAAPHDAGTLMLAAIVNISVYPSTANPPAYDPFKDFVAVSMVGRYDLALAVSAESGIETVPAYVAWAKARKDKANFGSPGNGSLPHLFGAQFSQAAGLDLVHVPFQGAAPSIVNLLGGQIGAVIQPVSDLLAQHDAGKIRILATTGSQRNARLPGVPTFKELGYRGMEGGGWIGFFAPAGTPDKATHAIWEAVQSIQSTPAVVSRMQALGFDVTPMTSAEFAELTRKDATRWGDVVRSGNILAKTP